MRQLALTIHPEEVDATLAAARRHGLTLFAQLDARERGEGRQLLILEAPNGRIEDFLAEVEDKTDLRALFAPQGIISLRPPASEPESQMLDIQPRSPLEVFLGALQSIGSWPGFLGYAVVGGVIVWIGLFTESVFLLVAAMLIAPFAGPAMTLAIATARGDANLLGRSLLRYVAALSASIATAFLLSIAFDQQIATELMIETSMRSTVSLLLPLAAGVAGALNLVQSERSSLVSGAATGMLVAAALAPPAGLIGDGAGDRPDGHRPVQPMGARHPDRRDKSGGLRGLSDLRHANQGRALSAGQGMDFDSFARRQHGGARSAADAAILECSAIPAILDLAAGVRSGG